jgi:hypothetical protein
MALCVGPDRRSTLNVDRGLPPNPRGAVLKSTPKKRTGKRAYEESKNVRQEKR